MKNKDFFYSMIVSLMLGLLIVSIVEENKKEPPVKNQIDTTSQNYYKKSLDSFFFDHSRIPDE